MQNAKLFPEGKKKQEISAAREPCRSLLGIKFLRGISAAELIAAVCRITEKLPKPLMNAMSGSAICGGSEADAVHPEENSRIPVRSACIRLDENPRIPTSDETVLKSTIVPRIMSMLFTDSMTDSENIALIPLV